MIFEALFLAFTLGSESAERKTAAIKSKIHDERSGNYAP